MVRLEWFPLHPGERLGGGDRRTRNTPDVVMQVMDATGQRGATFVLDLVGRATFQSSIKMLANSGRIVCVGTLSGDLAEIKVVLVPHSAA